MTDGRGLRDFDKVLSVARFRICNDIKGFRRDILLSVSLVVLILFAGPVKELFTDLKLLETSGAL